MPSQPTDVPNALLELSQRLDQWRRDQPPRRRLPESIWSAAAEMAQRHGLHRTTKVLRLDYTRLKKRLLMAPQTTAAATTPPAFLELLAPASSNPVECVVEWESVRGPDAGGHEGGDAGLDESAASVAGKLSHDPDHAADACVGRGGGGGWQKICAVHCLCGVAVLESSRKLGGSVRDFV